MTYIVRYRLRDGQVKEVEYKTRKIALDCYIQAKAVCGYDNVSFAEFK